VDTNGVAAGHINYVASFYNASSVYFLAFVVTTVPQTDITTLAMMSEVWALHQALYALRTPTYNKSYADICYRALGQCSVSGPFEFWSDNYTYWNETATSDDAVKLILGQELYPNGQPADRALSMANFTLDNSSRASAIGIAFNFLLEENDTDAGTKNIREFLSLVEGQIWGQNNPAWPGLSVQYFYDQAVDDALTELVSKDISLFIIAFVVMIAFTQFFLGRPFAQLESRALLALQAVLVVILSMAGGYGLCMACEVPFTTLGQVLPFLLLGVGIDNAFVVLSAVDRQDRALPLEDRMERAMARVGVNISVTSLVDFVALLFSLASLLPAVRYFGVYAAVSILYIYLSFMTVFVSLVALDERRRARGKMDWAVCLDTRPPQETAYVETAKNDTAMDKVDLFLQTRYAPVLLHDATRVLVIVGFLAATGVLLWAALEKTGYDFHVQDLLPNDSAAFEYIVTFKALFHGLQFPANSISLYVKAIDYADVAVQRDLESMVNSTLKLACIDGTAEPTNWHKAMTDFGKLHAPFTSMQMDDSGTYFVGKAFYDVLNGFLASPYGPVYSQYVVLDGSGNISLSAVVFTLDFLSTSTQQVAALGELRAAASASALWPNVFYTNGDEAFWEQLGFMREEATRLFAMTLVAVAVVCAIFLVHPVAILIQLVTLGMVFIDLMGALAFAGLDINSISVTNLIMAIGLVVDATVHVVRTFGVQDPKLSRKERTTQALGELGTPILLGAISLLLGVAALSNASSQVFHVFFMCFVFIVVIGWAHGLIFVPVLLSLFGPITFRNVEGDDFLHSKGGKRRDNQLLGVVDKEQP